MRDTIQEIRKHCRLAMNGVASTSMRQKGMAYKVNFGLVIQQIKDLANRYKPSAELAELLWKEDTRELKILATMLYPVANFSEDIANRWVTEIPNQEIREQVCINLFQDLPYANKLVKEWINDTDSNIRITGYWLLVRLFLIKKTEYFDKTSTTSIWDDVVVEDTFLHKAALLALKHIGRQSKTEANIILEKLAVYKDDKDPLKQEVYNSLEFEFEYYYGE